MDNRLPEVIAARTFNLLAEKRALVSKGVAFWVWPREDRVIVAFDPAMIDLGRMDEKFVHALSTRLAGRRIVRTNSRGLFLQIGYDLPQLPASMLERPLNLADQPTPLSLPVGATPRGVLWIPMLDGVSFLVAGATGMGKTRLVHGWIQALLHGGQAQVYAWDGKGGTEYLRYADHPNFRMIADLKSTTAELLAEANRRRKTMLESGATNLGEHNARGGKFIRPIALIVDEARLVKEDVRPMIAEIVERERAAGICPILCTNNPVQADILVKANLVTRICFAVPSWNASQMALGMNGAEKLKGRGRGLLVWKAHVMEFQSFGVDVPAPSEEAIKAMVDSVETASPDMPAEPSTMEDAKRILELRSQGLSAHAIVGQLYQLTSGRRYMRRLADVKALTSTSVTSTPISLPNMPALAV